MSINTSASVPSISLKQEKKPADEILASTTLCGKSVHFSQEVSYLDNIQDSRLRELLLIGDLMRDGLASIPEPAVQLENLLSRFESDIADHELDNPRVIEALRCTDRFLEEISQNVSLQEVLGEKIIQRMKDLLATTVTLLAPDSWMYIGFLTEPKEVMQPTDLLEYHPHWMEACLANLNGCYNLFSACGDNFACLNLSRTCARLLIESVSQVVGTLEKTQINREDVQEKMGQASKRNNIDTLRHLLTLYPKWLQERLFQELKCNEERKKDWTAYRKRWPHGFDQQRIVHIFCMLLQPPAQLIESFRDPQGRYFVCPYIDNSTVEPWEDLIEYLEGSNKYAVFYALFQRFEDYFLVLPQNLPLYHSLFSSFRTALIDDVSFLKDFQTAWNNYMQGKVDSESGEWWKIHYPEIISDWQNNAPAIQEKLRLILGPEVFSATA